MADLDNRFSYLKFIKSSKGGTISLWIIGIWLIIGLFSGLFNNDVPFFCRVNHQTYFPSCHQWFSNWSGISTPSYPFNALDWKKLPIENTIWCPVPYKPTDQDLSNNLLKPFSPQGLKLHHYLGTDHLGRDVASGLVQGAATAAWVGLGVMLLVGIIGILIGAVAGYWGNDKLKIDLLAFIKSLAIMLFLSGSFIAFFHTSSFGSETIRFFCLLFIWILLFWTFYALSKKFTKGRYSFLFPLDLMIMKLIEVIQSIPRLLLVLFFLTVLKPSVWVLIGILGGLGWTGIAKLTRAEVLKIRTLPFVTFAKMIGSSDLRILWKHILPNSLFPALISMSFSVSSAILAEAALSFLGIGLSINGITWGGLLADGKEHQSAWWLIFFPGVCIFLVVYCLNILGEKTQEYFNPRF